MVVWTFTVSFAWQWGHDAGTRRRTGVSGMGHGNHINMGKRVVSEARAGEKAARGLFVVGMAGTGAAIGEGRAIWRTSLALVLLKPLGRFGYRLPFLRQPAVILDVLRVPSTEDCAAN